MKKRLFLISIALLCGSYATSAEGTGEQGEFVNRYGICIGVNNYGDFADKLTSPANDAIGLYDHFSHGARLSSVKLFTDASEPMAMPATNKNIIEELARLRDESVSSPLDDVVFFFSGHGCSVEDETDNRNYFILGDVNTAGEEAILDVTQDLLPILKTIRCKRMYILLDTCRTRLPFSLPDRKGTFDPGLRDIDINKHNASVSEGVYVIYSNRTGQISYEFPNEYGVFSGALIDGLSIYRNFYDVLIYLDRSVPIRSYALLDARGADLEQAQYIAYRGDFANLRDTGYLPFGDLCDEVLASSDRITEAVSLLDTVDEVSAGNEKEIRKINRKLLYSDFALSKAIGKVTFSVGVGLCSGSVSTILILNTLENRYGDVALERSKDIAWTVFGGSMLLTIPSLILSFIDL